VSDTLNLLALQELVHLGMTFLHLLPPNAPSPFAFEAGPHFWNIFVGGSKVKDRNGRHADSCFAHS